MVGNENFLMKPKHNVIYPNEENVFVVANHEKKKRLLHESIFIPINRRTLIVKMVVSVVFLMKPKHQYHLS